MPSLILKNHLSLEDKNGLAVGAWAKPSLPGYALCSWCNNSTICFKTGTLKLTKHSETEKHINNKPKDLVNTLQLTLEEAISDAAAENNKELELKNKVREMEIDLVRSFSRHSVPFEMMDCLQEILKKHVVDSEVVKKMRLHHSKATYLLKNAVGPVYLEQTVKMLQQCDAFVIAFDESEINKRSELELMVKLSHEVYGIQLRHYRTLDLEDGEAQTTVDAILDSFQDDGIDYEKRLISSMSDGCMTNEGHKGGVKKLLSEKVPQLKDVGSCNDHHVGNAFKYAVFAFDEDCHEALVDIYQDIGGAKGKGLKKKKAFEAVCQKYSVSPISFKKLCTTRFRSYVIALNPVLSNWHCILVYYRTAKKLTARQVRLKSFLVDREIMTALKLNFIWSTSRYMVEILDFFEQRKIQIHTLHSKMTEVLVLCMKRFLNPEVVETMDDEGQLAVKSSRELLDADVSSNVMDNKKIFIGDKCTKIIKSIGLTPASPQLEWFFNKVIVYHRTVVVYLQKYFRKGLLSTELKYMKALSPKSRLNYRTPHMLNYLVKSFSKIVENISPDGMDIVTTEITKYATDLEIKAIDENLPYEEYWNEVQDMKLGEWRKYDILPRFALALGTFFNSNSETERSFSVETDLTRDPKKNRMGQELLESHMQVHFGVESPLNFDKETCKPCNTSRRRPHCHCSKAHISEDMITYSKKAYVTQEDSSDDEGNHTIQNGNSELLEEEQARAELFKEKLSGRSTFYSPNLMKPIYEKKAKMEKEKEKAKKKKKKVKQTMNCRKFLEPN